MKFVSAVTALVAAMAVGTEAKKVSRRELNQRMKNGQFDKKTLLAGAKPHNDAAKKRKLDENPYFTGDSTIQFKSCFSLTTSYGEMFEGDDMSAVMTLFSQGQAVALESYAVFTLMNSVYGTANEYVVNLDTYLQSLINYLPSQVEEYCQACEENYDYCYANANGNAYNGNRKLNDIERVLQSNVRTLDCGLCEQYGCIDLSGNDGANEDQDGGYESAAEWLEEITQCKETGVAYNGGYGNNQGDEGDAGLYAGMLCNSNGDGVEIGMFYDDECKVYLPNESFGSYMTYYDKTYHEMSKEVIEFTFSDAAISCKEQAVVYATYDNQNQYYNDYNDANDADDIAEWCEGVLMAEEGAIVDMKYCGGGAGGANYYSQYNWAVSYDDDELVANMATYDWYQFEISEEDAEDLATVCRVVRLGGEHSFYNTNNGNLYSYKSNDKIVSSTSSKSGASAGTVFGYIILVGLVAGAGVGLFLKFQEDAQSDKNVGLIDPEEVETKGGEVA